MTASAGTPGEGSASQVAGPVNFIAARTENLVKVYGSGDSQVVALDSVNVELEKGRFTAVMGPSGSGKSTLMHCVAGLDTPTSGRILIGDTEIGQLKDKELTELRRDRIGFVFQAFNLVPTLTAEENILLPLAIAGRKPDAQWYKTVVQTVDLESRLTHKPTELSGGQQQRVACARALVSRPDIIFADEPTGNLDSRSSAEVLGFLRRSVDEFGQTIVMVTHDPVAASYADRALFLADGKIVADLESPTREAVLEMMAGLDPRSHQPATAGASSSEKSLSSASSVPQASAVDVAAAEAETAVLPVAGLAPSSEAPSSTPPATPPAVPPTSVAAASSPDVVHRAVETVDNPGRGVASRPQPGARSRAQRQDVTSSSPQASGVQSPRPRHAAPEPEVVEPVREVSFLGKRGRVTPAARARGVSEGTNPRLPADAGRGVASKRPGERVNPPSVGSQSARPTPTSDSTRTQPSAPTPLNPTRQTPARARRALEE